MPNILLQLVEPEAYHHAIAQEAERSEAVPLDDQPPLEDPEALYNRGFGDGWADKPQDKQFTWSLDYAAGYSDAVADSILAGNQCQFNLNHSEADEF